MRLSYSQCIITFKNIILFLLHLAKKVIKTNHLSLWRKIKPHLKSPLHYYLIFYETITYNVYICRFVGTLKCVYFSNWFSGFRRIFYYTTKRSEVKWFFNAWTQLRTHMFSKRNIIYFSLFTFQRLLWIIYYTLYIHNSFIIYKN